MERTAEIATAADTAPRMALEVIVLPVTDPERAKRFYAQLGWRLDVDFAEGGDYRVIQFTPPGSGCSVIFGAGVTDAEPGSLQGLHLVVPDLLAALGDLARRGVEVSSPFHDLSGVFHHVQSEHLAPGPNPSRKSYASFATFRDPDGNRWVLQEVTTRLTGPVPVGETAFTPQLSDVAGRLP